MQRAGAVRSEAPVALEHVQRLADRCAAARRRTHAPDVEAAVGAPGRLALDRPVAAKVALGHQARPPDVVGVGGGRRALRGAGDGPGQRAAVEGPRSLAPDQAIGPGEVGVSERAALVARRAVGVQVDRLGRGNVIEVVDVGLGLRDERPVDGEAVARHPDAGPQGAPQRPGSIAAKRLIPARDGARHAGGETAVARVAEAERRAVLDERVRLHRAGRLLARVDRGDPALRRADDHEAATPDAARVRLGHAEHRRRGDRRVDGVAASLQRVDRSAGAVQVDGGRRATGADGRRLLGALAEGRRLAARETERQDGRGRGGEA